MFQYKGKHNHTGARNPRRADRYQANGQDDSEYLPCGAANAIAGYNKDNIGILLDGCKYLYETFEPQNLIRLGNNARKGLENVPAK